MGVHNHIFNLLNYWRDLIHYMFPSDNSDFKFTMVEYVYVVNISDEKIFVDRVVVQEIYKPLIQGEYTRGLDDNKLKLDNISQ